MNDLASSETYKSEFDAHWANVLQTQLMGDENSATTIASAVKRNLPYDQLVQQLLIESKADFESVCQNMLGARMDCVKCHSELGPASEILELYAKGFDQHREEFSQSVAQSDEASEALVNNVWAHFFGTRLTSSHLTSTAEDGPSLQSALEGLTQEFITSGYDTRVLATLVALSEPFGLSDRLTSENEVDSAIARQPMFARFYSRREFGDSIAASLAKFAVADIDLVGKNATPVETVASLEPRLMSKDAIKKDEAVWQDIAFMNSDPDRSIILDQHGPYLEKLANAKLKSREKVDHIFLYVIGRLPTRAEREPAVVILRSQKANAVLGLRDVWWAVSKGR